jgi:lysozyme
MMSSLAFQTSLGTLDVQKAVKLASTLCRKFEGLYRGPYLCPAGVWTIGYGATYYENGVRVKPTDLLITKERAEQLLQWHLRNVYLPAVLKHCPQVDSPEHLAVLIDFVFNLGDGRLSTSTLKRRVNAKQYTLVPQELRKWNRGGGRVLRGLSLRREAECLLWNSVKF